MQPYQSAAQEISRQGELPIEIAKKGASIGSAAATAYLGGGAINRVLPFLSKYIPENLVKKGLSKIDPRYGKFIDKALSNGQTIEDVKNFIGEKIQDSPEAKQNAKQNLNIIEQESPELHQFILDQIKKGKTPTQAGASAYHDKKFMNAINKLKNTHKTNWDKLIETVYGSGQTAQPQQTQPQNNIYYDTEEAMNPAGSMPTRPPSAEAQAAMQTGNQRPGLDPAVSQIINQGNKILKRFMSQP